MKKAFTMFAAAAAILFAGVNASAAVNHPIGTAVKGPKLATPPPATGSVLTITSITVGTSGFTPCYGCAGGADVDLPYPVDVIPAGTAMTTTIQMQDVTYSGAPTVVYGLLLNGTLVSEASVTFPFDLFPNEEALAYFPETAPTTTGTYQVVGEIYNGSTRIGALSYYINVY